MSDKKRYIEKEIRAKLGIKKDGSFDDQFDLTLESISGAAREFSRLNTDRTHFIFELIQNADDNKYPKKVLPSLKISVLKLDYTNKTDSNLLLEVENNEVGFNKADVRSICQLGNSTKVNNFETTGEKGIGFKSVFRVTDYPHVVSNGFYLLCLHFLSGFYPVYP